MDNEKATQPREPGYYIVIPAQVWFDHRLRPNSTKLYGVISALCGQEGYCWASDAYLGQMLHQSERTVRELLKELTECGHLWLERDGTGRQIWIRQPLAKIRQTSGENPPDNNKSNNNTPYSPPKGDGDRGTQKGKKPTLAQQREQWFDCIWEIYPNHGARAPALKRWLRMRPDVELARRIYRVVQAQVKARKWSPGYWPELRNWLKDERWTDEPPQSTGEEAGGGTVVESEEVVYW